MRLKSFRVAIALAATAVAGAALLSSAAPATADAPYSNCPGWALCLYQHAGGTGSKEIISAASKKVSLLGDHFLNGQLSDNQVSSYLNNSNCLVDFYDDPEGWLHQSQLEVISENDYGHRGDWGAGTSNPYANDRLSSLRLVCP